LINLNHISVIKGKKSLKSFWKKIALLTFTIILFASPLDAQVVNSVYSMFGVGQLMDNNIGINKSLGGTGIAFQSGKSINYMNPASYIGMYSHSYVMELGLYGITNKSMTSSTSQRDNSVSISYFSASLYFTKWWASSFGIIPFSSVDYEINSEAEIEGELTTFQKTYTGSGGLSRIYFGNSFSIIDGLSIGFNSSYIVGPVTQTETASGNDSFASYSLTNERLVYSVYFDYGLQYTFKNDDWSYSLGLIYGSSKKLNSDDDLKFTYNGTTTSLTQEKQYDVEIPQKTGVGIAVKNGDKFRIGIDYEWAKWSSINFTNSNLRTKNSNRFSIGVEYYPAEKNNDTWLNTLYYRIGANYKNTYLKIDNTPINSKAINVGLGIPYNYTSLINLSLEYGEEGTLSKGLIKNKYWAFYLSLSLPDFWISSSSY
jgi:hypothetical protein